MVSCKAHFESIPGSQIISCQLYRSVPARLVAPGSGEPDLKRTAEARNGTGRPQWANSSEVHSSISWPRVSRSTRNIVISSLSCATSTVAESLSTSITRTRASAAKVIMPLLRKAKALPSIGTAHSIAR